MKRLVSKRLCIETTSSRIKVQLGSLYNASWTGTWFSQLCHSNHYKLQSWWLSIRLFCKILLQGAYALKLQKTPRVKRLWNLKTKCIFVQFFLGNSDPLQCRFCPEVEKLFITNGSVSGLRKDLNGVLLLDSILQPPLKGSCSEPVVLEFTLPDVSNISNTTYGISADEKMRCSQVFLGATCVWS